MAKRITTFWRLLLGTVITLLGFTACKTSRKAQKGNDMRVLYGPPPAVVDGTKQTSPIRLLYGPPPVRAEQKPEK